MNQLHHPDIILTALFRPNSVSVSILILHKYYLTKRASDIIYCIAVFFTQQ